MMSRNVSNCDASELLFPNSRSCSDEVGLGDILVSTTEERSLSVLEKCNSENETITFPLSVKNMKAKSYCDSMDVCCRAKCRCSSPQRWNKTDDRHVCKSETSCCIINVKNNKSEVPSEDYEIGRLSNELGSNLKLTANTNCNSGKCTCHLDSTKPCETAPDYASMNGVLKVEKTWVHLDSKCGARKDHMLNGTDSTDTDSAHNNESSSLLETGSSGGSCENAHAIEYVSYASECQMPDIMRLIQKDLSEPYSIYTYRYFIHNWPNLCFLALDGEECVGAIVCKLDMNKNVVRRGYIAMLAVDEKYRKQKIGSNLVLKAIQAMIADDADEVVLETEITNKPALRLYENLGFVRDKRLFRYYLNGVDALRLKLWLR